MFVFLDMADVGMCSRVGTCCTNIVLGKREIVAVDMHATFRNPEETIALFVSMISGRKCGHLMAKCLVLPQKSGSKRERERERERGAVPQLSTILRYSRKNNQSTK